MRIYRVFLSPVIHWAFGPGSGCRFTPSCSQYAEDAIQEYGLTYGGYLAFRRVLRCHPFTRAAGYDPVPRAIAKTKSV